MRCLIFILCFCSSLITYSQNAEASKQLNQLVKQFEKTYYELNLPGLVLDFRSNLRNELNAGFDQSQYDFFTKLRLQLVTIDTARLSRDEQVDYHILYFESLLHLERLALLAQSAPNQTVDDLEKLYDFPSGPEWYAFFIKKWTGSLLSPQEIMDFGHREITRVTHEIEKLNLSASKPAAYFTRDRSLIIETLKAKRDQILSALPRLMPDFEALPNLSIAQGTNARLAQTPGYYSNNTFYFNLFDKPFDLADCDWLLIHEGNPGHHFQVNYHQNQASKPYRRGLRYLGFIEGWAAYTENLGWEMGLYKSAHEALGKWNWDLIRSVRVVLDVGLNYHGWSDEQAMAFWQQHIRDQDDIGLREINRMKQWPAQVLTYKLGEATIRELLSQEKLRKGNDFNFKDFHTAILSAGIVPVVVLPRLVN